MALFSVDGFSMEFVLGNDVIKFAQRQSNGYSSFPTEYKYYTGDEILYLKKQVFTNTPYGLSPIESAWDYIRALTNTFSYSTEIASNAHRNTWRISKGCHQNFLMLIVRTYAGLYGNSESPIDIRRGY